MEETSSPAPKRRRRNPVRANIQPVPVRSRSIQILSEPETSSICQKKSQSDNQIFKSEIESGMSSSSQVQPVPVNSRSIQYMSDQSSQNDIAVSESLSTLGEPNHSGSFQIQPVLSTRSIQNMPDQSNLNHTVVSETLSILGEPDQSGNFQIRPDFQTTRQELEPEISTSLQIQPVSQIAQPEVFRHSKSSIQQSVARSSEKKPPASSSSETRRSSLEHSRIWEIVESSSQKNRSPEPVLSSSESQQSKTREPETVGRLKLVLVSSENARKRKLASLLEGELLKRPSGDETDGLVSEQSSSEQNLANTEVQSSTESSRNRELGQDLLSVQFDSESSRIGQRKPEITRRSAENQSETSERESEPSERELEPSERESESVKSTSEQSELESEPSEQEPASSESVQSTSEPSEVESEPSEKVSVLSQLESVSSEQEPASSESVQSTSEPSRNVERQPELTRTVSSTAEPFTNAEEHSRNQQQQLSSRCSLESVSAAQYSVKHFRKQQLSRFSLPVHAFESESIQTSFEEDARKQQLSRFSLPDQDFDSESVQTTSVVEHSRSSVPDFESGEGSSGPIEYVFSNPRPGIKILVYLNLIQHNLS
jgi:hypothetical protein